MIKICVNYDPRLFMMLGSDETTLATIFAHKNVDNAILKSWMISQKVQVLTLKTEGYFYFGLLKPGFRIRINFMRIRIQGLKNLPKRIRIKGVKICGSGSGSRSSFLLKICVYLRQKSKNRSLSPDQKADPDPDPGT